MSWRGLRRFITENLAALEPSAQILNVGAGGRVAKVIAEMQAQGNFSVTSVDIDAARKPDVVADIITYAPKMSYDAIVMIEVLEHVKDPGRAIENVYGLLKPGGCLFLSTPFLFPLHDRPMDFFRFTRYGLELLFGQFATVEIRARDGWAETFCVLLARLFREQFRGVSIIGPLAVFTAAALYPVAALLSRLIVADGYTSGYTVRARKQISA
jgi:SAM-dependent methyltransferase